MTKYKVTLKLISLATTYNLFSLGPVYTKHQRQCCDNSAMTLVILLSLKSMEMQTDSGASLQSCTTTLHLLGAISQMRR